MRDQEWDATSSKLYSLDPAELVLSLSLLNSVHSEPALSVVDKTEVFASLFDRDDIHEACGIRVVGSDFAVNLDKALHEDCLAFSVVECVL